VNLIEALTSYLDSGGHRRNLRYFSCKVVRGGAYGRLVKYRNAFQRGDLPVRIQGSRDGAESGSRDVVFVETARVPGKSGRATYKKDEEPGGKGI
jgi:hypothetical protein